jgi:hypothetical protein
LALYHLLADETKAARYFYQEALAGEVLVHPNIVSDVIHDLDDFLVVFPNNADAKMMRDLFETRNEP